MAAALGVCAAVALGLAAGALLTEGAVLVPWWQSLPPEAFLDWYATNAARLFNFFGVVEIAASVLAVAAAALYRFHRGGGGLFVAAAGLAVAVLSFFPLYFEQVNADFAAGTVELEAVAGELALWAAWHWARTIVGVAAFVAALLAVRAAGAARRD